MTANVATNAALLIIDVQTGFKHPKWGPRNNPDAEDNIARLLEGWRASDRQVVFFQHRSATPGAPLHPASPGYAIQDLVAPRAGDVVMTKEVNSCFIGTDLEPWLRDRGIDQLVITGLTAPHCVSTTTRMAENLGFEAILVSDATASFAITGPDGRRHEPQQVHDMTLAVLDGEFATVASTAEVLAAL